MMVQTWHKTVDLSHRTSLILIICIWRKNTFTSRDCTVKRSQQVLHRKVMNQNSGSGTTWYQQYINKMNFHHFYLDVFHMGTCLCSFSLAVVATDTAQWKWGLHTRFPHTFMACFQQWSFSHPNTSAFFQFFLNWQLTIVIVI